MSSASVVPSAAALVQAAFPGRGFIPIKEVSHFIGWAYQTARHHLVNGTFPVQTVKIGKKRLVPVTALIDFYSRQVEFAGAGAAAPAAPATATRKRGPGRPRNAANAARVAQERGAA